MGTLCPSFLQKEWIDSLKIEIIIMLVKILALNSLVYAGEGDIIFFWGSVAAKSLHLSVFRFEAILRRDVSFFKEANEREMHEKTYYISFSTTKEPITSLTVIEFSYKKQSDK